MTDQDTAAPARLGTVCRCGAGPHDERPGHCARGHMLPGNREAATTLQRTTRWPSWLTDAVQDFAAQALADDGGAGEVPARRQSMLAYRAKLHGLILAVSAALEHHGLMDRRGKLRENWLRRLESLISTAKNIDATLGYERRQRDALSIHDYINQARPQDAPQVQPEGAWGETGSDRELAATEPTSPPQTASGGLEQEQEP